MTTATRPQSARHSAPPSQSTALVRVEERPEARAIVNVVEQYQDEIAKLAPRGVEPAHYLAALKLYFAQHEKLLECTPVSVAQGILRVAQTGLDLGVSCDLLPFGATCQFNPRYNGLVELALASGVRAINADVVREGDFFDWEKGTQLRLRHRREAKESSPITHAYAVAEIKVGAYAIEVVPREHIELTRKRYSKQWKDGPLEAIPWYAKKTAIRRLSPMLPKNARFASALMYTADAEGDLPDAAELDEGDVPAAAGLPAPADDPTITAATATADAQLATEAQTERLLDLISSPHINDAAKERVRKRLEERSLPARLAATWITALELEIEKYVPGSTRDGTGADELPLGKQ